MSAALIFSKNIYIFNLCNLVKVYKINRKTNDKLKTNEHPKIHKYYNNFSKADIDRWKYGNIRGIVK